MVSGDVNLIHSVKNRQVPCVSLQPAGPEPHPGGREESSLSLRRRPCPSSAGCWGPDALPAVTVPPAQPGAAPTWVLPSQGSQRAPRGPSPVPRELCVAHTPQPAQLHPRPEPGQQRRALAGAFGAETQGPRQGSGVRPPPAAGE